MPAVKMPLRWHVALAWLAVGLLAGALVGLALGVSLASSPPKVTKPKLYRIQGRDDLLLRMGTPYKTSVLGEQINAQLKGAICTIWGRPSLWVAACWPQK